MTIEQANILWRTKVSNQLRIKIINQLAQQLTDYQTQLEQLHNVISSKDTVILALNQQLALTTVDLKLSEHKYSSQKAQQRLFKIVALAAAGLWVYKTVKP